MNTKRMLCGAILSILMATTICASDPGTSSKGVGVDAKGFPKAVVNPPEPKILPDPNSVLVLAADTLYVADFDEEGVLLVFPEGLVKITHELGPMRIKAKFADGNGSVETRTYSGKHIYTLEVADVKKPVSGRVTAAFVPFGFKSENQIKKTLVDILHAPLPPPKPDPTPPKPDPPKPLNVSWVIIVEDTTQRTPETARVILDTAYWDGLKAKGIRMRSYAKNSPDVQAKGYWREFGLPYMLLLDANGKDAKTGLKPDPITLPTTTAAIDAILKGGK